jgi:hypothetical protein
MFNKPYLLNYCPKQGRKVKVCSVTSGVGQVAHRKICALAKSIARREHEIDRRERGIDVMTVEFHVADGDRLRTPEGERIDVDEEGEGWKQGKQA